MEEQTEAAQDQGHEGQEVEKKRWEPPVLETHSAADDIEGALGDGGDIIFS